MTRPHHPLRLIAAALLAAASLGASAQDKTLNLYSARHYQSDELLFSNFTKATGIQINRIDSDDAGKSDDESLNVGTASLRSRSSTSLSTKFGSSSRFSIAWIP